MKIPVTTSGIEPTNFRHTHTHTHTHTYIYIYVYIYIATVLLKIEPQCVSVELAAVRRRQSAIAP
jgi:hypothetical protein